MISRLDNTASYTGNKHQCMWLLWVYMIHVMNSSKESEILTLCLMPDSNYYAQILQA